MTKRDDANQMTPDERLREIARILAVGVLRMRRRLDEKAPKLVPESPPEGLDVLAETRLSVRVD